jgi:hypothetical protein
LGKVRDTGGVGFGNAREVRNLYEQTITRQSARVIAERNAGGQPDLLLLMRDDLLGPRSIDVSSSKALQELQDMRGLQEVKESVNNLLSLVRCVVACCKRTQNHQAFVLNAEGWLQAVTLRVRDLSACVMSAKQ